MIDPLSSLTHSTNASQLTGEMEVVGMMHEYATTIDANGVKGYFTVEAKTYESAKNKLKKMFKELELPIEDFEVERI